MMTQRAALAAAAPSPALENSGSSAPNQQALSEERRLRIRNVLENALKITSDVLEDDDEDDEEFLSVVQGFAGRHRQ